MVSSLLGLLSSVADSLSNKQNQGLAWHMFSVEGQTVETRGLVGLLLSVVTSSSALRGGAEASVLQVSAVRLSSDETLFSERDGGWF